MTACFRKLIPDGMPVRSPSERKGKTMKKLLFSRDSACVAPILQLMMVQKHRTLVLWAQDCAQPLLALFEARVPGDPRPREALAAAGCWMRGEIKMPVARKAILAAHRAASEAEGDPAACAAARAVAHAAAAVHVETHSPGLVLYGLTAAVYTLEAREAEAVVAGECKRYYDRLLYWQEYAGAEERKWAPFLARDDVPNKERMLWEKKNQRG